MRSFHHNSMKFASFSSFESLAITCFQHIYIAALSLCCANKQSRFPLFFFFFYLFPNCMTAYQLFQCCGCGSFCRRLTQLRSRPLYICTILVLKCCVFVPFSVDCKETDLRIKIASTHSISTDFYPQGTNYFA